jgi:hypothetical protein
MSAGWSLGEGRQAYSFHKFRIRNPQEGGQPPVSFMEFWWELATNAISLSVTDGVLRAATRALGGRRIPQCRIRIGLTPRGVEDSRPGAKRVADCPRG